MDDDYRTCDRVSPALLGDYALSAHTLMPNDKNDGYNYDYDISNKALLEQANYKPKNKPVENK